MADYRDYPGTNNADKIVDPHRRHTNMRQALQTSRQIPEATCFDVGFFATRTSVTPFVAYLDWRRE